MVSIILFNLNDKSLLRKKFTETVKCTKFKPSDNVEGGEVDLNQKMLCTTRLSRFNASISGTAKSMTSKLPGNVNGDKHSRNVNDYINK